GAVLRRGRDSRRAHRRRRHAAGHGGDQADRRHRRATRRPPAALRRAGGPLRHDSLQGTRAVSLVLTAEERAVTAGSNGAGAAMAMHIVTEAAHLLGAPRLIPIASAHIDGAL